MYSPLTTSARSIVPCRIQLLATVTPVNIPAQAFERSNVIAFSAPIVRATAPLMVGSSHCVKPSRSLVMLQLITTSTDAASRPALSRHSTAAAVARL